MTVGRHVTGRVVSVADCTGIDWALVAFAEHPDLVTTRTRKALGDDAVCMAAGLVERPGLEYLTRAHLVPEGGR
jgi:hypothetical protein